MTSTRAPSSSKHAVVYFPEPIGAVSGAAVAESFRTRQRLYDGIPRTAHLCLNVIIELDRPRPAPPFVRGIS